MFNRYTGPNIALVGLVVPSCRLVPNTAGLVAYFTQIVHYAQWLCYCCVSYPGYVLP